jgi:hypothetical protein
VISICSRNEWPPKRAFTSELPRQAVAQVGCAEFGDREAARRYDQRLGLVRVLRGFDGEKRGFPRAFHTATELHFDSAGAAFLL